MDYKETPQSGKSYIHMWDVASTEEFNGGFAIEKSNLPATQEKVLKGTFLKVDFNERIARVVKTAQLTEAITAETTSVKVKKGAMLINGDILGSGTKSVSVANLDTTNPDYDTFTITAGALGTVSAGSVLQEYAEAGSSKPVVNPDGMAYTDSKIDALPSCTVIFKAYDIQPLALPQPLTSAIVTALNKCQFIIK